MKFNSLHIKNLRAVEDFSVADLPNFVVIAGQNGSGKSCVFDAIRLLKSLYGGYSANEFHQWFGEFAINLNDPIALRRIFRNPDRPLEVTAEIEFAESERKYLLENVIELATPIAWQRLTGQVMDSWTFSRISLATQLQQLQPQLNPIIKEIADTVREALTRRTFTLSVVVSASGILLEPCPPAELAFQSYKPESLGVIEYHSATRTYNREDVGGVNLNSRVFTDQRRQQTLYNSQGKYQNIKSELASGYVRNLIAREVNADSPAEDLNETLAELFRTFFPDKEYLGVTPLADGGLDFPVRLASGRTHDIDDLSSGEKEILYGYLRLKNSTPRHSVILLDEPELHLNPSLLHGFADFYYRHLGVAQDNQLWLVTHSDALLRQAVGNSNYRVFHMTPATSNDEGTNQASEVLLSDDVERATIDLVGDLASYRPHSKVVILEGQGSDGFDVSMVRRLFPSFARRVNLVSGGNKFRVRGLYRTLSALARDTGIENRFYAITDMDREPEQGDDPNVSSWDVYHIENYLLHPESILRVLRALGRASDLRHEEAILTALKESADETVDRLTLELLQEEVNEAIISAVRISGSPTSHDVAASIKPSIDATVLRVSELGLQLTLESLGDKARAYQVGLRESLGDGTWMSVFPGRSILKRFLGRHALGVDYEVFANLILDRMAETRTQPKGMESVLRAIAVSA